MAKPPCCARIESRLTSAKQDLARLARLEAYHAQKCHDISRFPAMLRTAKAELAKIKEQAVEHEAEHAEAFDTTSAADYEQLAAHSIQVGARA